MRAAFIRLPRGLIIIAVVLIFIAILFGLRFFIINNSAADAMAPALFGKSVVIDPGPRRMGPRHERRFRQHRIND